ncbi:MAG TPA: WbuC family cupin fold metalloprotein [Alphaproteobacteria bacterium]|nr:WbuC family cupin fold metalloprotein [Alphaproteobacteria bacterium]
MENQDKHPEIKKCILCDSKNVDVLVDFGEQPVSNKFLKDKFSNTTIAGPYGLYKLSLGQCSRCSLIQLTDKVPMEFLKAEFDWITYMEPEQHLDDTVEETLKIGAFDGNSRILGLSFKDESTLERFKKKGYNTTMLDLSKYLGEGKAGIESIQKDLPNIIKNVVADIGKFDLIVARHIVEHSYDLDNFLNTLKQLLTDDGYILFEVPDFEKSLNNLDYPSIWEEHTIYFTESTLKATFDIYNMPRAFFKNYDYPMENSLMILVKNADKEKSEKYVDNEVIEKILEEYSVDITDKIALGTRFGESFDIIKKRIKSFLKYSSNDSSENFAFGLVGAGHLGAAFLNYFDVKENFKYVIDDNSNKSGLYMPGTDIQIVPSSVIKEDKALKTLLLSINPRNEQKFLDNNKDFLETGGKFYSIFLNSQNPMPAYYELEALNLKRYNDEVFYPIDGTQIVKYYKQHLDFLRSRVGLTVNKRIRVCGHMSSNDLLHEMIILLDSNGYVRPHKHGSPSGAVKAESYHVIEGALDIVLFNDDGTIKEVVSLNAKNGNTYYRLNGDIFHTVLIRDKYAIIHETTTGPFRKEDATFADWAPEDLKDEESVAKIRNYILKIKKESKLI